MADHMAFNAKSWWNFPLKYRLGCLFCIFLNVPWGWCIDEVTGIYLVNKCYMRSRGTFFKEDKLSFLNILKILDSDLLKHSCIFCSKNNAVNIRQERASRWHLRHWTPATEKILQNNSVFSEERRSLRYKNRNRMSHNASGIDQHLYMVNSCLESVSLPIGPNHKSQVLLLRRWDSSFI